MNKEEREEVCSAIAGLLIFSLATWKFIEILWWIVSHIRLSIQVI